MADKLQDNFKVSIMPPKEEDGQVMVRVERDIVELYDLEEYNRQFVGLSENVKKIKAALKNAEKMIKDFDGGCKKDAEKLREIEIQEMIKKREEEMKKEKEEKKV